MTEHDAVPVSAEELAKLRLNDARWEACRIYGFPVRNQTARNESQRWTVNWRVFGASAEAAVDALIARLNS